MSRYWRVYSIEVRRAMAWEGACHPRDGQRDAPLPAKQLVRRDVHASQQGRQVLHAVEDDGVVRLHVRGDRSVESLQQVVHVRKERRERRAAQALLSLLLLAKRRYEVERHDRPVAFLRQKDPQLVIADGVARRKLEQQCRQVAPQLRQPLGCDGGEQAGTQLRGAEPQPAIPRLKEEASQDVLHARKVERQQRDLLPPEEPVQMIEGQAVLH